MLRSNVAHLLRAAPGTSERIVLAVPDLGIADDVTPAGPVEADLRLSRTSRGILVRGHVQARLAEACSRCLRPAEAVVSSDIEEEALPSVDLDSGLALDTTIEPDVLRLDDHHELDLEPLLRDAISLAEPIAPLCRPDCPGLCETCGVDLSDHPDHEHADADVDPRLAVLSGLRDQLH